MSKKIACKRGATPEPSSVNGIHTFYQYRNSRCKDKTVSQLYNQNHCTWKDSSHNGTRFGILSWRPQRINPMIWQLGGYFSLRRNSITRMDETCCYGDFHCIAWSGVESRKQVQLENSVTEFWNYMTTEGTYINKQGFRVLWDKIDYGECFNTNFIRMKIPN